MKKKPDQKGRNLIFLISQPRAGSTMLQRILGNHEGIYTFSEPWVMLHPAYALKESGFEAEYSADLALKGTSDFISQLPRGKADYIRLLGDCYGQMYTYIADSFGKQYYLDKTPRYYNIIEELRTIFPESKIILLFRNPLAVLASIISTWTKQNWFRLSEYRCDLIDGPDCLINGLELLKENSLRLSFENFLLEPENTLKDICKFLEVEFKSDLTYYGEGIHKEKWQLGDQGSSYNKEKPDKSHADKWVSMLDDPQTWRVISDYCDLLGNDRFRKLGYSYESMRSLIDRHKPEADLLNQTESLIELIHNDPASLIETRRKKENQRLNVQLKRKEKQIQDILNSYTFKLGKLLLAPISKGQSFIKKISET